MNAANIFNTTLTRASLKTLATALLVSVTSTLGFAQVVLPGDVIMTEDARVEAPLTSAPPDAFRGLNIFIDLKLGNCVACHTNFDVAAMQFLGEIGPNLDWIGDYYSEAELRGIMVDSKFALSTGTVMPAFYTAREGYRTLEAFRGKTILTAQEVEDVVAYLVSLTRDELYDGVD